MTVVAGIDEAGYGPLLGPLVVAAAAFRLEPGAREADLHALVGDRQSARTALPLADSKQVYHGQGSLAALEAATYGHLLLATGALPVRMDGLLAHALDLAPGELEQLPWYAGRLTRLELPRDVEPGALLERARRQGQRLAERGLSVAGVHLLPVPVPRFNRITNAAGSKAFTLFRATGRLIETLVAAHPHDELSIHVDRQGGRIHYGDLLQTFFPFAPLTTVSERPQESSYRLPWPGRPPVEIRFRVKADDSRAPVALASLAAKTTRELFMTCLNAWFAERLPGLAPTAGYAVDGQRFLADVSDLLTSQNISRELLVRSR